MVELGEITMGTKLSGYKIQYTGNGPPPLVVKFKLHCKIPINEKNLNDLKNKLEIYVNPINAKPTYKMNKKNSEKYLANREERVENFFTANFDARHKSDGEEEKTYVWANIHKLISGYILETVQEGESFGIVNHSSSITNLKFLAPVNSRTKKTQGFLVWISKNFWDNFPPDIKGSDIAISVSDISHFVPGYKAEWLNELAGPDDGYLRTITLETSGVKEISTFINTIKKRKMIDKINEMKGKKKDFFRALPMLSATRVSQNDIVDQKEKNRYFTQVVLNPGENEILTNFMFYNETHLHYKIIFEFIDYFHDLFGDRTNLSKNTSSWKTMTSSSNWPDFMGFLWTITTFSTFGASLSEDISIRERLDQDHEQIDVDNLKKQLAKFNISHKNLDDKWEIFASNEILPKTSFSKRSSIGHTLASILLNTRVDTKVEVVVRGEIIFSFVMDKKEHLNIISNSQGHSRVFLKKRVEINKKIEKIHKHGGIIKVTSLAPKVMAVNGFLSACLPIQNLIFPNRKKFKFGDILNDVGDDVDINYPSPDAMEGLHIVNDSCGFKFKGIATILGAIDDSNNLNLMDEGTISAKIDASIAAGKNPALARINNGFNLESNEPKSRAAIPCHCMPHLIIRNPNGNKIKGVVFILFWPEKNNTSEIDSNDLAQVYNEQTQMMKGNAVSESETIEEDDNFSVRVSFIYISTKMVTGKEEDVETILPVIFKRTQNMLVNFCEFFLTIKPANEYINWWKGETGNNFWTYLQSVKSPGIKSLFQYSLLFGYVQREKNDSAKIYEKKVGKQRTEHFKICDNIDNFTNPDFVVNSKEGVVAMLMLCGISIYRHVGFPDTIESDFDMPICCTKILANDDEKANQALIDRSQNRWKQNIFGAYEFAVKNTTIFKSKGDENRKFDAAKNNIMITVDEYLHKNCMKANIHSILSHGRKLEFFIPKNTEHVEQQEQLEIVNVFEILQKNFLGIDPIETENLDKIWEFIGFCFDEYIFDIDFLIEKYQSTDRIIEMSNTGLVGEDNLISQDIYWLHFFCLNLFYLKYWNLTLKLIFLTNESGEILDLNENSEYSEFMDSCKIFNELFETPSEFKNANELKVTLLYFKTLFFSNFPDLIIDFGISGHGVSGKQVIIEDENIDGKFPEKKYNTLSFYAIEISKLHKSNMKYLEKIGIDIPYEFENRYSNDHYSNENLKYYKIPDDNALENIIGHHQTVFESLIELETWNNTNKENNRGYFSLSNKIINFFKTKNIAQLDVEIKDDKPLLIEQIKTHFSNLHGGGSKLLNDNIKISSYIHQYLTAKHEISKSIILKQLLYLWINNKRFLIYKNVANKIINLSNDLYLDQRLYDNFNTILNENLILLDKQLTLTTKVEKDGDWDNKFSQIIYTFNNNLNEILIKKNQSLPDENSKKIIDIKLGESGGRSSIMGKNVFIKSSTNKSEDIASKPYIDTLNISKKSNNMSGNPRGALAFSLNALERPDQRIGQPLYQGNKYFELPDRKAKPLSGELSYQSLKNLGQKKFKGGNKTVKNRNKKRKQTLKKNITQKKNNTIKLRYNF